MGIKSVTVKILSRGYSSFITADVIDYGPVNMVCGTLKNLSAAMYGKGSFPIYRERVQGRIVYVCPMS